MKKIRHIKHFSNDRNDALIVSVRRLYGMEGYGVYWAIMEMLSAGDGYMLPTEYGTIAEELNVTAKLVEHIVEDHGLFIVADGMFHSQRLTDEMSHKEKISEVKRQAGIIGMKSRYDKNKPAQATPIQPPIQTPTPQPKSSQQAPKARSKKYTPDEMHLHSQCKEFFSRCYKQYKGTDYYWSAKEMGAVVGVLKQIRFMMEESERNNLDQLWVNYQAFIQQIFVKADDWIIANVSPTLIQSKFNEIYTKLKNGTKRTTDKSGNARDDLDFVASIAKTLQSGSN